MNSSPYYLGVFLKNTQFFKKMQKIGFDYILNPDTGELHQCVGGQLQGSHQITTANLEKFIGLTNIGLIQVHLFPDGTSIPIHDLLSGELIGTYSLNKCQYCFPS
jgi:hypothetical protein